MKLPTDMKYFRKNIGLTDQSGKLPLELVDDIKGAKSIAELDAIDARVHSETVNTKSSWAPLEIREYIVGTNEVVINAN